MTVTTCCFCFSLRGGVIIIATLSIFFSLHNVTGMMKNWSSKYEVMENDSFVIQCPIPSTTLSEPIRVTFKFFVPAILTDDPKKIFIFFYFICSGLLLLSTFQNERTGFLPWIYLTTICMIFHIEFAISGCLNLFAYCDLSTAFPTLGHLIIIYGFEIYLITMVYYYYKQLGEELINQTNGRVFSCEDNAQVNSIPGIVTCPIPNDLPPSYDQVVGTTPQRHPVY